MKIGLVTLTILLVLWAVTAYVIMPAAWRWHTHRHPAIDPAPRITRTALGIPGDPLNVALVGDQNAVVKAVLAAGWHPADPITLRTSLRIARSTVLHLPYEEAPVSNLYLWDRVHDLAFQQCVGGSAKQRHHVRFWRSEEVDEGDRPLWLGAATYDTRAGLSHTTGQITHHISADVDAERDKLLQDLQQASLLARTYWVDGFQEKLQGRNGGGDPYRTDGRLGVGVVVPIEDAEARAP